MVAGQVLTLEMQVRLLPPQPERKAHCYLFGKFIERKELAEATTAITATGLLTETGNLITTGLPIVWDIITGNVVLTIMVGASLLTLAFRFYRKAKRAAH